MRRKRRHARNLLPYEKAKALLAGKGIASRRDYEARHREFVGLPTKPHEFYKDKWIDWYAFLGLEPRDFAGSKYWPTFQEAREKARKLDATAVSEYRKRRTPDLPKRPFEIFKDEWTGWADYLGDSYKSIKTWDMPYEEFKDLFIAVCEDNEITKLSDWDTFVEESGLRLPKSPEKYYYGKWEGIHKVLGIRNISGGCCICCDKNKLSLSAASRRRRGLVEDRVTLRRIDGNTYRLKTHDT